VGGSKLNNSNELVDAFNQYFITKVEKVVTMNSDKNEANKLLNTSKYVNIPEMKLIPITEAEIKNILKTMKQTKKILQGMTAFQVEY
jgi:hypothetical protein